MSTTNILDLNNRIDALDAVMPRTASGTTAAQIVSAYAQLDDRQKMNCVFVINDEFVLRRVRITSTDDFNMLMAGGSTLAVNEWRLNALSGSFTRYNSGATAGSSITITAWTLYYQGTPIS